MSVTIRLEHTGFPDVHALVADVLDALAAAGAKIGVGELDLDLDLLKRTPPISVDGNCTLSSCCVTQIPKNLSVGGGLDLAGTSIERLPEGLTVGGTLTLAGRTVSHFPKGLVVVGNVLISRSPAAPHGAPIVGNVIVSSGGPVDTSLEDRLYAKGRNS